jgi:hypothetical protein
MKGRPTKARISQGQSDEDSGAARQCEARVQSPVTAASALR